MKNTLQSKMGTLLIGFALLAGCLPKYSTTLVPSLTSTNPAADVSSETNTETSTIFPFETSNTNSSTIVPSQTHLPSSLQATIIPSQRESEIEELLTLDENCKLPCWWNFIPGSTSSTEAEQFLSYMNVAASTAVLSQATRYEAELGNPEKNYSLTIEFIVQQNLVEGIIVRSLDNFDLQKFQNDWSDYQPIQIMQKYGTPSRVWLLTSGIENNGVIGGLLLVFYDEQGFLIIYQIGAESRQNSYHFCPKISTEISLFLQSPNNSTPLDVLATDLIVPEYIDTVEQATAMTIEEFHKRTVETGCFDTSKNIGP